MELNLTDREWREFKINDIFIVSTGSLIPKEILKKGEIPRLTATDNQNGIFNFYEKIEHKNYREVSNFISISFLGSVFYHPYPASLDMKIHAIQIRDLPLNKYLASFLVFCFKRMASNYSYGDQLSSSDLPKKRILLPITKKGKPDYEYMEVFMKKKEEDSLKKYTKFISKKIKEIKDFKEVVSIDKKEWKEFFLNEIFLEIQRGKRLKKEDHIKGQIPYVSSSALNNGIDGFVSNDKNVRIFSNCISLANSGSVGATFYQPFEYVASDHVTKLENNKFNEFIYLFISTIAKRLSEKYSFNREINDQRIKREKIVLPIDEFGQPDYVYMENYIKKIEYEKLTKYIEIKTPNGQQQFGKMAGLVLN